jgi:hypothetical protein
MERNSGQELERLPKSWPVPLQLDKLVLAILNQTA